MDRKYKRVVIAWMDHMTSLERMKFATTNYSIHQFLRERKEDEYRQQRSLLFMLCLIGRFCIGWTCEDT